MRIYILFTLPLREIDYLQLYLHSILLENRKTMNVEKIDSRYRLLQLIYKGKTSGILTDEALRESLNDLMKYELVTIYNNKLSLTERGKIALKNGINSVITKVRPKPKDAEKTELERDNLTALMITIAVLLLVILLFMTL